MEIQRSRRIGALAVSCDAYPVIDQKLLHSRDFLRIYQGSAGEEKVIRPADFLKFQFRKILADLFLRTSCTKESGSGIPVKLHGHPETEITVCPGITSLSFIAVTDLP